MKLRKFISLLASGIIFISSAYAANDYPNGYWAIRERYVTADNAGDYNGVLRAVADMENLYPTVSTVRDHEVLIWPYLSASVAAEKAGYYDKAIEYSKKFINSAKLLQEQTGANHAENIKFREAILNHLTLGPEVYTDANYPADVPYHGAMYENEKGAFIGSCYDGMNGSLDSQLVPGFLLYVRFFDENVESFAHMFPQRKDIYFEIAWNLPEENIYTLQRVLDPSSDEYIISNLKYISTIHDNILLRFGAEVNCWDMPADESARADYIETYKQAFRKISTLARQYAPNAALVYSPSDISNMYVTAEDFYPGDEYVDWVGMSVYDNINPQATNQVGDVGDAYFCRGVYDNVIVRMRDIIEAFGERKPILVSESGFSYHDNAGVQTLEHALSKMKEFYTYADMVYPEIKGIMYFNKNMEKDFSLTQNDTMRNEYYHLLQENLPVMSYLNRGTAGYTRFSTLNETRDVINLYTYAMYPGAETSVSYSVDGVGIPSQPEIPYRAQLDVSSLSAGAHKLEVSIWAANTNIIKEYDFYVGENGFVSTNPIGEDIGVSVNGKKLYFDVQPALINDRTLVPMRAIFEALGASVSWDNATQTATGVLGGTTVKITIDSNVMYKNGSPAELDAAATIINDRTLVPVRAISEAFGAQVGWDEITKQVTITVQ